MWILKKKYDYWWKKYGLEKTDMATKTSLFDRNWAISLIPRQKSRPLSLIWWALPLRVGLVHSGSHHHSIEKYLVLTTDKLYPIMLYRVHLTWLGFKLTMLTANCISSCKSNYNTITTMMTSFPIRFWICSSKLLLQVWYFLFTF